tara:strand:+ start:104 stop:556 length:453 start_codon:yes stop_codon:yes gene_type:complete
MFCTDCGIELDRTNKFCTGCGALVSDSNEEDLPSVEVLAKDTLINLQEEVNNQKFSELKSKVDKFKNKVKNSFGYKSKDLLKTLQRQKEKTTKILENSIINSYESISKLIESKDELDIMETRLKKLKSMFDRGLISEEEYTIIRKKIMKL